MESLPSKIAVFIVTRGREAQLRRCLGSLGLGKAQSQLIPYVLLNGSDLKSERLMQELEIPFARANEALTPARARNLLVNQARAFQYDWAFFIDDDAYVPSFFFERFSETASNLPDAGVIGGPNLTPPESNLFQQVAGVALSCRFGSFLSSARYLSRGKPRNCGEEELILCNLFVRKSWIERFSFPETFICAEENGLLYELRDAGAAIYHDPGLAVFHDRRESPQAFAKQVLKYGRGRGQMLRQRPRASRLPHLLPSFFIVTGIIACALLGWALGVARGAAAMFLLASPYFVACAIAGWRSGARLPEGARGLKACFWCFGVFPIIHFSYGSGVLLGLFAGEPKR